MRSHEVNCTGVDHCVVSVLVPGAGRFVMAVRWCVHGASSVIFTYGGILSACVSMGPLTCLNSFILTG